MDDTGIKLIVSNDFRSDFSGDHGIIWSHGFHSTSSNRVKDTSQFPWLVLESGMKAFGVVFIAVGIVVALLGFGNIASDIQLGIGVMGIAITGIGVILFYLSKISEELDFFRFRESIE